MTAQPAVSFDTYELERLAATLDGAIRIRRRTDYYLWAQGALQSFLPHETLVCLPDGPAGGGSPDVFSRSVIGEDTEAFLRATKAGLRAEILDHWSHHGRRPYVQTVRDGPSLLAFLLDKTGGPHALVHCTQAVAGRGACAFLFLGMADRPGARELYLAELLLPQLYFAFAGLRDEARPGLKGVLLSRRQSQVLAGVRSGKTNTEIAQALGLSPLTVKSHVQQALRKLAVANRAEAAAVTSGMTFACDGA